MPYTPASPEGAATRPRPGAAQRPPGELLAQAAQLAEQAQLVVEKAVIAERAKGTSWEVIGEILGGVSKSAAQKRWGTTVAQWRESADIDPHKLPAYVPDDLAEFSAAYDELDGAWKQATEIVARQPLLADLNNATAALSGSPGVHTGTGRQYNFLHYFPAARLCTREPESHEHNESVSLLEVAHRVRAAQEWEAVRTRGVQAVEAILAREERDAGVDLEQDPQDREAARARGKLAVEAILAKDRAALDAICRAIPSLPEDLRDIDLAPPSWAAGSRFRRDYSTESRRRNVAGAQAEFRSQKLTLEERVTRLERAFDGLLTDEPEGS